MLWERRAYNGDMSTQFKAVDRETIYLFPPSVQDWLPERHLARFVVDVVSKLDLHELKMPYTGVGSEAFNPEMLLAQLFYGYATGVFSSRKLEQLSSVSLAWVERGHRRMDVGQHRLEFETDVHPRETKAAGPRGLREAQVDSF